MVNPPQEEKVKITTERSCTTIISWLETLWQRTGKIGSFRILGMES